MGDSGVFTSHTMTSPLKEPAAMRAGLRGWHLTHMRQTGWSRTWSGWEALNSFEKRLQIQIAPGESHHPLVEGFPYEAMT
jgi:hypothetical protein